VDWVIDFIEQYGAIAIFVVIALEYACFPLPSELVLPFAGAIAAQGSISFPIILLVSILAGMTGCLACYAIGYKGGRPLLDRIIRRFPGWKHGVDAAERYFMKYGHAAVGIGRVIPLCRTYISFIAGITRQNIVTYLIASSMGISVWNTLLVGVGYMLGENWKLVSLYYGKYQLVVIPIVCVIVVLLVWRKWVKHRNRKTIEP
jgi:membrane protein DedA with SNARE-associated domain